MEKDQLVQDLGQELLELTDQKSRMIDYLKLKLSQEDWHGVADAAMDIREIVSKTSLICNILTKLQ